MSTQARPGWWWRYLGMGALVVLASVASGAALGLVAALVVAVVRRVTHSP